MRHGDPRDPGGHADSCVTALALYLRPDSVRVDRIVDPGCKPVNWADPKLNFADYSPNGVVGAPIYATAQLGQTLWKELVDSAAGILKKISEE